MNENWDQVPRQQRMTRRAIWTLSRKYYKKQGQVNMKKMSMPRTRFQQLNVVTPENKHPQEGHLRPGTKIYFMVYVMPVIIMVIKLYIAEHTLDLDIIGAEADMRVLNTKKKEIIVGDHKWVPTETITGLRH